MLRKIVQFIVVATICGIGAGCIAALGTASTLAISMKSQDAENAGIGEQMSKTGPKIWTAFYVGLALGAGATAVIFFVPKKSQQTPEEGA